MSIVESAMERIKKAQSGESQEARPVPRGGGDAAGSPQSSHRPRAAIRWSSQVAAELDVERLRARGLYPPKEFAHRLQEEYRAIRREVIAATREKVGAAGESVGPIIVVTSALPGDGKSYTALNLALSIAKEGTYDVLLIDADTVKRSVTAACGLAERPGLLELLSNPEAAFADYCYTTTLPHLYVLPAGIRSDNSTDLFSAGRVGSLFDSIRSSMQGHFVVVDTPPLLVSSESSLLTDVAGQVLLVVQAGRSLQESVKDAVARIRESIPIGVVLNGWSPMLPAEKKAYAAYHEYTKK